MVALLFILLFPSFLFASGLSQISPSTFVCSMPTGSGSGTVTSVGITETDSFNLFSFSGTPVTTAGTLGVNLTGTVPVVRGGTGINSCTTGDLLYSNTSNSFTTLGLGSSGYVLTANTSSPIWQSPGSGGIGSVKSVGLVDNSTLFSVSNTPITSSGNIAINFSGSTGDTLYASNASTLSKLGIGSSGKIYVANTSGPVWQTPPTIPGGTVTSVDATVPSVLSVSGVPITSSGTIAITYSGTALPIANGGTNNTTSLINGRIIVSGGGSLGESAASLPLTVPFGGTGITSYTAGDVLYASSATTLTKLGIGSSGQVLTANTGAPIWLTKTPTNWSYTSSSAKTYNSVFNDNIIAMTNATSGFKTVNLPSATTAGQGHLVTIKDEGGNVLNGVIIIAGAGGQTVDGSSTRIITQNYGVIRLYSNGSNWFSF